MMQRSSTCFDCAQHDVPELPDMTIRLATRASRLALWQTEHVADLLQKAGFETEIVPMQTTGDAVQDRSLG